MDKKGWSQNRLRQSVLVGQCDSVNVTRPHAANEARIGGATFSIRVVYGTPVIFGYMAFVRCGIERRVYGETRYGPLKADFGKVCEDAQTCSQIILHSSSSEE